MDAHLSQYVNTLLRKMNTQQRFVGFYPTLRGEKCRTSFLESMSIKRFFKLFSSFLSFLFLSCEHVAMSV